MPKAAYKGSAAMQTGPELFLSPLIYPHLVGLGIIPREPFALCIAFLLQTAFPPQQRG